jgi:hypothetical protein
MNIASAQMLQDSLRSLADTIYRNRALDESMQERQQRNAIDQAFRQAQLEHYKQIEQNQAQHNQRMEQSETDRNAAINAPKVQADITEPETGTNMTFTGTPEQLQKMQDAYSDAHDGQELKVSGKRAFAAQFNVGGAQFSFEDQDSANKFASDMQANHGVNVYDPQYARGGAAAGDFSQSMARYNSELQAADDSEDPAEQQQHLTNAALEKAHLLKLGQWAPKPGEDVTFDRDAKGRITGRHTTYQQPAAAGGGGSSQPAADAGATAAPFTPPPGTLGAYLQGLKPLSLAPGSGDSTNLPPTIPSLGTAALNANGIPTGQPALPAAAATAAPQGMVRVQHPNGQTGLIPANSLPAALQQGYQVIGQ